MKEYFNPVHAGEYKGMSAEDRKIENFAIDALNKFYNSEHNIKNMKAKKTGIELITQERQEQIERHGRSIERDVIENANEELNHAAATLLFNGTKMIDGTAVRLDTCPSPWEVPLWQKMASKPYKERLIIAGALIAAEIDRLQSL